MVAGALDDGLKTLYETARELTLSLDLDTVLRTIVLRARALLASDLAYVTLVDRSARVVRMRTSVGHRSSTTLKLVLPIGEGIGGVVAKSGRTEFSGDYLNDDRIRHNHGADRWVRREGIRSIVGVPLCGRAGLLGVLYAAYRMPREFTDGDTSP